MTNEYAAALAKEAECAFRATQQTVDRYNVIHAQAPITVTGTLLDIWQHYEESGNPWLIDVYKAATSLSIDDKAPPPVRCCTSM